MLRIANAGVYASRLGIGPTNNSRDVLCSGHDLNLVPKIDRIPKAELIGDFIHTIACYGLFAIRRSVRVVSVRVNSEQLDSHSSFQSQGGQRESEGMHKEKGNGSH